MEIQTSRFGTISVDDERVITFPRGLLGFPDQARFALIQTGEENYFFWLQCVDEPNLAFVVTDPSIFFKEYEVPIKGETQAEIALDDVSFAQVFVICNKVDEWLAQQVVLTDKKWTTRQPLMRLQAQVPLAKSA